MEWLSAAALSSIGALVSAVVGAIIMIIKDRRNAPIEKKTAEMATTTALANASKTQIEMALQLNTILQNDNAKLTKELAESDRRINVWEHWYNGVQAKWLTLRDQLSAPPSPCFESEEK